MKKNPPLKKRFPFKFSSKYFFFISKMQKIRFIKPLGAKPLGARGEATSISTKYPYI